MSLKLPGFSSSRTKRIVNALLYYVMIPLPSQVLISAISLLRKKASTRREQNGYLSAKVYKIFEMPLLFRELFREKSKKIDVGAHKKGK